LRSSFIKAVEINHEAPEGHKEFALAAWLLATLERCERGAKRDAYQFSIDYASGSARLQARYVGPFVLQIKYAGLISVRFFTCIASCLR
jgi:hypothetical protein